MQRKNIGIHALSASAILVLSACKFKAAGASEFANKDVYSCRIDRAGLLSLCTEYRKLPGEALEEAQRTCQSYAANGYEWVHAPCAKEDQVGGCTLGSNKDDPRVPSVQFHYSPFFTDEVAAGMCQRMGGVSVPGFKG